MTTPSRSTTPISMSIVDVYDVSAIIGREFDVLIDQVGTSPIASLLNKVVQALEALEDAVLAREKDEQLIFELKRELERLENETALFRKAAVENEEKLNQVQDGWQDESASMQQLIKKLSAENINLRKMMQAHSVEFQKHQDETTKEEIELLTKLKQMIDQQRTEIRLLRKEISERNEEINAVQQQSSRLAKLNAALRHRQSVARQKAEVLIEEKSLLESELRLKEQRIQRLNELLQRIGVSVNDAVEVSDNELQQILLSLSIKSGSRTSDNDSSIEEIQMPLNEELLLARLKAQGKVIIDSKDPNRPRYTLLEFQTILSEKTELLSQIDELREELNALRIPDDDVSSISTRQEFTATDSNGEAKKKKESGIKKFFSSLFSSSNGHSTPSKSPLPKHISPTTPNDGVYRSLDSTDGVQQNSNGRDDATSTEKEGTRSTRHLSAPYNPQLSAESFHILPSPSYQ